METPYERITLLAKLLERIDEDLELVLEEVAAGTRDAKELAPLITALINLPLKIQARIASKIIRELAER